MSEKYEKYTNQYLDNNIDNSNTSNSSNSSDNTNTSDKSTSSPNSSPSTSPSIISKYPNYNNYRYKYSKYIPIHSIINKYTSISPSKTPSIKNNLTFNKSNFIFTPDYTKLFKHDTLTLETYINKIFFRKLFIKFN